MDKIKYTLGDVVKGAHYGMIAQGKGAVLWWYEKGQLKTVESDGNKFHWQYVKIPDRVFRGRATKSIGGVLTILPPKEFCSYDTNWVNIPAHIFIPLIRQFQSLKILVDLGDRAGMRILNIIESI